MIDTKVGHLIQEAKHLLNARAAVPDAIGEEAGKMQHIALPPQTGAFLKSNCPVSAFASDAIQQGLPAARPLLDALASVSDRLPWKYNYAIREDMPNLGSQMAWCEIIGPEAPFVCRHFCFGFTLIAPNSFYPAHQHPAIELYYVLSGTAEWTLEGKAAWQAPGSFILHPSNAIHSMRTSSMPLLAMYTWSGDDVITLSKYVSS